MRMHEDADALGIERPDARAARDRIRSADAVDDRHARAEGPGLSLDQRRRELCGAQVPRLRQAERASRSTNCTPASAWPCSTARKTRSTPCCGRAPSPPSPTRPSGPATTAPAVPAGTSSARPWPAQLLGRDVRHPRRRRRPAVSASRERDRAERGRQWQAAGPLLDAQRLHQHRQREDVQEPGQLLPDPRRAEASTTPRRCASSSRARTTAARSTTATCTSTMRAPRSSGSTRRCDLVTPAAVAIDWHEPACRTLQGGDGRGLRHARSGGGAVRARRRGEPHAVRPRLRAC